MLALSMLDGSFVEPGPGDQIIENPDRPDEPLGQHRKAAQILLESPAVAWAFKKEPPSTGGSIILRPNRLFDGDFGATN